MKKVIARIFLVLSIVLSCFIGPEMVAMAGQSGWVKNADGAWTYMNKNGKLAKGYCRNVDGDNKYYFFWCPGYHDEDGNTHETYTLAWNKLIIKDSTGEPMYYASEEGPLLENYEITYNGYIYKSNKKGVLKKKGKASDGNDYAEDRSGSSSSSGQTSSSGTGDISSIYLHQETNNDCTATAVAMMLRSRAIRRCEDPNGISLSGLKNNYWSSYGMAWSGTYGNISFTSDDASIKNNSVGSGVGNMRYNNLASTLSAHPEGVVLYLYDSSNGNKSHAVFVTRISNGTIYCLDPAGPGYEIPISDCSTYNYNFGLSSQDSILRLDNTGDGRSFLWYCTS
ncbi:hypothetical protein [Oribacterium sp. FC2011]|uniref:hypothetical protein n=1 Tax=Oribacterium sp. FC2011 TaxID=1408311 RepID=UPI0004E2297C|nr:hypothetical protein [Oribacterium sp. FC2011]